MNAYYQPNTVMNCKWYHLFSHGKNKEKEITERLMKISNNLDYICPTCNVSNKYKKGYWHSF
jgi:hypothetical protein